MCVCVCVCVCVYVVQQDSIGTCTLLLIVNTQIDFSDLCIYSVHYYYIIYTDMNGGTPYHVKLFTSSIMCNSLHVAILSRINTMHTCTYSN